ncbi:glycoside hydrolase family 71/99-like protein [Planctomycetes bacterium CA13]|uniref:glycoside hydrolase family 71/99-like protein n=1 Tax=Novipirellula herctigrandis TaxID=2527986 RepID=UPI0011B46932
MIDSTRPHRILAVSLFFVMTAFCGAGTLANQPAEVSTSPLVLAHYMPWYTAKPFRNQWGWHWTMNHFDPELQTDSRREVASKYYPLIGPYDSGDTDVLEYHLLLMKVAGIDGVIVDWYGLTDLHDYKVLHDNTLRLVEQVERLGMKFAICYEDQTLPALIKANRLDPKDRVDHVVSEIEWMASHWFTRNSYVQLEDRPVLLSFGNAGLTNPEWTQAIGKLKAPVAYFSEHICRDGAIGGFDWPIPKQGVERTARFGDISRQWQSSIPVVFPRFVDIYSEAKVRDGYPPIEDNDGKTFQFSLQHAFASKAPLIQIATWNDWGEGTNIEPSEEFGYRDLEVLQQARRQHIDATFSAKAEDLRLPVALFRLRQLKIHNQEHLSAIAKNIVAGRMTLAKRQIEFLEAKKP